VITVDQPATTGRLRIDIACANPSTDECDPQVFEGDVTANSLDDVAIAASRPPSISIAANVGRDSPYRIEVFKGDGRTIRVPIYDDNGSLVDLTLWENFRFSIQNEGQTTVEGVVPYHLTEGVTGGADGYLSIPIPEDCPAYALLEDGVKSVSVYWSGDANRISDGNTKTRTLRAGPFVIKRKETA